MKGKARGAAVGYEVIDAAGEKFMLKLDVAGHRGMASAAEVVGGSLEARDECSDARAFAPEAIPWEELAFESTRAALKDYLRRFYPRVRPPR